MAVKKNDPTPRSDATAIEDEACGVADPAPVAALEDASGTIIEPAIANAVNVSHDSVDANPRTGTTATQSGNDWNDPRRVRPDKPDFSGQGVDRTVYGKAAE